MDNEKVNEAMKKGVAQVQAVYAKGNELMDRVSFLKNSLYKKIVWGVLGLVVLLAVGRIFGCGGNDDEMPTQEEIVEFCRSKLVEQYDKESLQKFEPSGFSVDEGGTVTVRAEVRIKGKSPATGRSWNGVRGTAVFTLRDIGEGDGLHIVDFGFE